MRTGMCFGLFARYGSDKFIDILVVLVVSKSDSSDV